jgi:hypothetical protein
VALPEASFRRAWASPQARIARSRSLSGLLTSRPMNSVDMHGFAMHRVDVGPLETFTDLRGNPNRATIIRCNEAHDPIDRRVSPSPLKRGSRRFRRKAVAPSGAVQDPAEIDTGPGSLRMVKANTADHVSRRPLDDRPMTVSAQLPMSEHLLRVFQRQVEATRRFEQSDLLLFTTSGSHRIAMKASASASSGTRSWRRAVSMDRSLFTGMFSLYAVRDSSY